MHKKGSENEQMTRSMLGPNWRRQVAITEAEQCDRSGRLASDPVVRRAAKCFQFLKDGHTALAEQRYPDIIGAEQIAADATTQHQLQMLVLADCSADQIADRLGLDPGVIETYEALHFDVHSMLSCTDWIYTWVVLAASQRGDYEKSAELRTAYWGGSFVAEGLLDGKSGLPAERVARLQDAATLLHAKAQAALEIPLTPETQMKYLAIYSRWMIAHDRLDLERQKFQQRNEALAHRREKQGAKATREKQPRADVDAAKNDSQNDKASDAQTKAA